VMLVRLIGVVLLVTFCAFYAYLPGEYDVLAVPLSVVAQALAVLTSVLIAPVGVLWLLHRMRVRASRSREHATPTADHRYLRATAWAAAVVAVATSLVAWGSGGRAFGGVTLALAASMLAAAWPRLRDSTSPQPADGGWLPTYLAVTPVVALLLQVLLAEPMASFSRDRAMANSATLIGDIERHRASHGSYPESLSGAWPDYKASVVGIAQFHYARRGEAFTLHFEQPVPQIHSPGTREFLVYNPLGQHLMLSHAAWHLSRPPSSLAERHGWYAARDAASPGWKRFLFD
jgi:hypothetical protein